ncbi:MAG: hypothetical protein H5T98_03230 [Syntrophomonadaceae bacterium]|nr:hypothetical protein [Syntrophomonadaceae bacterium]
MITKIITQCERCGKKINKPGLCDECLKQHDRVVKIVMLVSLVLAAISFCYYFKLFIIA